MERAQLIRDLNERFSNASAQEVVGYFLQAYAGRIALSSSLSIEDQVLTDIIVNEERRMKNEEFAAATPSPDETAEANSSLHETAEANSSFFILHSSFFILHFVESSPSTLAACSLRPTSSSTRPT